MDLGSFCNLVVWCAVKHVCIFHCVVSLVSRELKYLVDDLEECTPMWFDLGLVLDIPMTQLEIISNQQPYSRHLVKTLNHWMDKSQDTSWEALIDAVDQLSHRRLARELKKEFL